MERTKCQNWRISIGNQNFYLSYGLPQSVVVPISVTESQLAKAAEHFCNRFFPIWVCIYFITLANINIKQLLFIPIKVFFS